MAYPAATGLTLGERDVAETVSSPSDDDWSASGHYGELSIRTEGGCSLSVVGCLNCCWELTTGSRQADAPAGAMRPDSAERRANKNFRSNSG